MTERCEGENLETYLKAKNGELINEELIWRLFIEVCFAIQYLHTNEIFNFDLSLSNVMLTSADSIKIVNVGKQCQNAIFNG